MVLQVVLDGWCGILHIIAHADGGDPGPPIHHVQGIVVPVGIDDTTGLYVGLLKKAIDVHGNLQDAAWLAHDLLYPGARRVVEVVCPYTGRSSASLHHEVLQLVGMVPLVEAAGGLL